MRKKTIGEVFYLARHLKNIEIKKAAEETNLPEEFLISMESNDFEKLPGPFYTKKALASYAHYLDLDQEIVWKAYDEGSLLAYDEVEVRDANWAKSRRHKQQKNYWPLFYLLTIALSILVGMGYFIWRYQEKQSQLSQAPVYSTVYKESITL